jgi:hypothetical protein
VPLDKLSNEEAWKVVQMMLVDGKHSVMSIEFINRYGFTNDRLKRTLELAAVSGQGVLEQL